MLPLVLLFLFATVLSVDEEVLLLCGVGAAVIAVAVVCRYEKRNHFHWQLVRSFCWLPPRAAVNERSNHLAQLLPPNILFLLFFHIRRWAD